MNNFPVTSGSLEMEELCALHDGKLISTKTLMEAIGIAGYPFDIPKCETCSGPLDVNDPECCPDFLKEHNAKPRNHQ